MERGIPLGCLFFCFGIYSTTVTLLLRLSITIRQALSEQVHATLPGYYLPLCCI